jgi:cysteinyl-tRNA synthetase
MALEIYNTLTRKKEPFIAQEDKNVRLFVCGPTVYNYIHIGNARTYIFFDFFAKYMRSLGYDVDYLQNITDIDDKIIARGHEEGRAPEEVAKDYGKKYFGAMEMLGVTSVSHYSPSTDAIPDVISQIERLIVGGHAYAAKGNVYFSVASDPEYGKLSHQNIENLSPAEATDQAPGKKSPHDFTLWKAYKDGEPFWESPWGKGRPGWHIEDTAIAEKYFGAEWKQYDIHGGGLDIIFPHHECEIAQAEAITETKPYVRTWMHTGLLTIRGEKMSKSLGNFITIHDLLEKWSPEVVRLAMLSAHYRSPLDYSEDLMKQSQENRERLQTAIVRLQSYESKDLHESPLAEKATKDFSDSLLDDINIPAAMGVIFTLVREINSALDANSPIDKKDLLTFFENVDTLLGLNLFVREAIPEEIQKIALDREKARAEKNWARSDELRGEALLKGYEIKDTPSGPQIRSAK